MSALIGLSQKEINSIVRARKDLLKLDELTGSDQHERTCENLLAVLQRVDRMYGPTNEENPNIWRQARDLLKHLQDILPPEEEDERDAS